LKDYNGVAESSTWRAADPIDVSAYAGQTIELRWHFDTRDNVNNFFEGWYIDDVLIQQTSSTNDFYSFHLDAGQSSSLAVKGTGAHADVQLYDASGNLLALSDPSSHGIDGVISNFVAPASATYYAKISAAGGASYGLVVTRGADFDHHNGNFNTAQQLDG